MRKGFTVGVLCVALALAASVAQSQVVAEHRAEKSYPVRFDKSLLPLRDMVDRETTGRPRGGRDFEPGRPEAVGYNVSSSSIMPSIRYAVRGPADPLGTLGGETSILTGTGSQTGNSLSRWGDYSTVSVDPVDGCTMVFTTEYFPTDGSFNWNTWIASFKLSTCQ